MPPRWAVFAIVVFWLSATGWLVQRDMWPYWFPPPDEPPPFDISMLHELSTNSTNWRVYVNDEDVGSAVSDVKDMNDGSMKFNTKVRFNKKLLFDACSFIESSNRITTRGELLKMSLQAGVKIKIFAKPMDVVIDVEATVENGHLNAKAGIEGSEYQVLDPIKVPENGIVFNPAHLGTSIRNLRDGQSWRVPLLDIEAVLKQSKGAFERELWASVSKDVIEWAGEDVPCFKIEFTQPKKGTVATSWARRRDGQILKQQAKLLEGIDLTLIRVYNSGN
jgi:hypothetical protein